MKPTTEQMADAMMHATAWGDAWDQAREIANGERRRGYDGKELDGLAKLAMLVTQGYRKIANGSDIQE